MESAKIAEVSVFGIVAEEHPVDRRAIASANEVDTTGPSDAPRGPFRGGKRGVEIRGGASVRDAPRISLVLRRARLSDPESG